MSHKVIKLTPSNNQGRVAQKELQMNSHLIVNFEGAGDQNPPELIQSIEWTRTVSFDEVSEQIVKGKFDRDWRPELDYYPSVKAPEIPDYTAHPKEIDGVKAERKDQIRTITYQALKKQKKTPVISHVTFEVDFTGAGEKNPDKIIQKATIIDGVPDIEQYQDVKIPVVAGYHTKQAKIFGPKVSEEDQVITVTYQKNASLILVDRSGKEIAPAQILKLIQMMQANWQKSRLYRRLMAMRLRLNKLKPMIQRKIKKFFIRSSKKKSSSQVNLSNRQ